MCTCYIYCMSTFLTVSICYYGDGCSKCLATMSSYCSAAVSSYQHGCHVSILYMYVCIQCTKFETFRP